MIASLLFLGLNQNFDSALFHFALIAGSGDHSVPQVREYGIRLQLHRTNRLFVLRFAFFSH